MNKPERFLVASMEFASLWKQRQDLLRTSPRKCECSGQTDMNGDSYGEACFDGKDDIDIPLDKLCDVGKRRREIYLELIRLVKLIKAARVKMLRAY